MAKARAKQTARRLPVFRSDDEERRFWETHSFADYFTQTRPARVQLAKGLRDRVNARKSK